MPTYNEGYTFVRARWQGRSTGGSSSVPGLKVGDRLMWLSNNPSNYDPAGAGTYNTLPGSWELFISVNDEIQQVAGPDLSDHYLEAIFLRNL